MSDDPFSMEGRRGATLVEFSSPLVYLMRMGLFVAATGAVLWVLVGVRLEESFFANPGLNGLILAVLFIGMIYAVSSVLELGRECRRLNNFRRDGPGTLAVRKSRLLGPLAGVLAEGSMEGGVSSWRALLDSVASRLEETHETIRYIIGLLVFLGLLGTFWGLLDTVSSVGETIRSLKVSGVDAAAAFESLRVGLEAPLSGMGTAFSSSLFGLGGSLILGFLELQANQARNCFFNELEEWLSGFLPPEESAGRAGDQALVLHLLEDIRRRLTGGGRGPDAS